jgi:hypothetical protein
MIPSPTAPTGPTIAEDDAEAALSVASSVGETTRVVPSLEVKR